MLSVPSSCFLFLQSPNVVLSFELSIKCFWWFFTKRFSWSSNEQENRESWIVGRFCDGVSFGGFTWSTWFTDIKKQMLPFMLLSCFFSFNYLSFFVTFCTSSFFEWKPQNKVIWGRHHSTLKCAWEILPDFWELLHSENKRFFIHHY